MKLKSKKDIELWLDRFTLYPDDGQKHYFVFPDYHRGGTWTLMLYPHGVYTLHGKGKDYCDPSETQISTSELISFIWKHRKAIHQGGTP